jgi:tetratricopeptide (TPR) repeat protein
MVYRSFLRMAGRKPRSANRGLAAKGLLLAITLLLAGAVACSPQSERTTVASTPNLGGLDKGFLAEATPTPVPEVAPDVGEIQPYLEQGIAHIQDGQLDAAIAEFNKAIDIDPSAAIAYLYRGIAYAGQDRLNEAIADYTRAIDLDPDDPAAYLYRGSIFAQQGDLKAAVADFTSVIERDPDNALAYYLRGNIRAGDLNQPGPDGLGGDLDAAMADYAEVIRINPEFAEVYNNRGWLLARRGRYADGLSDIERSLDLYPQSPHVLNSRAFALVGLGRYEEALTDVELSLQTLDDAWNKYVRAGALAGLRRYGESIVDLENAISLDPLFREEAKASGWFEGLRTDPTFGLRYETLVSDPGLSQPSPL